MVAPWLFVTDRDVLRLERDKHGEDVVEGKLVVIPGTLNTRARKVAHCILTGWESPVCSWNSRGGAHWTSPLVSIALQRCT